MGGLLPFLVSFEIKEEYGTNVENKIQNASVVIGDKAKYKFRVVGEAKIIAIFEVEHCSAMNQITSEITRNIFCNLTCTPLTHLESWQKRLGSSSSHFNFPHRLSGNDFLWFEVGNHHEISKKEFDTSWERVTYSMILQLREGQIEIEIFKVLGERRLYGFTSKKTKEDWETQLWSFQAEDKIYKNAKLVTKI